MSLPFMDAENQHFALPDSPFLEKWLVTAELPDERKEQLRAFGRDGYLVLDLGEEEISQKASEIVDELAPRYPEQDRRVAEAWYFSQGVREIAMHPRILSILEDLYQRRAIPFQTLNFDAGTEQAAHSDTLHFHCIPHGFMCGVWVALEDIDAENGPLFVHPGSHRLPVMDMFDLGLPSQVTAYHEYEEKVGQVLEDAGYGREELHLRKGEAIIWSANLFHGGSPVLASGRTRHSQVTHYYFEGGLYYIPMASDPVAGRMCYREVIDIGRMEFVTHHYRGREVRVNRARNLARYPRPLPRGVKRKKDWAEMPLRFLHGVSKSLEALFGGSKRV